MHLATAYTPPTQFVAVQEPVPPLAVTLAVAPLWQELSSLQQEQPVITDPVGHTAVAVACAEEDDMRDITSVNICGLSVSKEQPEGVLQDPEDWQTNMEGVPE